MDSAQDGSSGIGGFGNLILPLTAFAAGYVAPERANAAFQYLQGQQQLQERRSEREENRGFREREFTASEAERQRQQVEREDIGKTRSLQRDVTQGQLKQQQNQMAASSLLPQLNFEQDLSVGSPDLPPVYAPSRAGQEKRLIEPVVPGNEVRDKVQSTYSQLIEQAKGLPGVEPGVLGELYNLPAVAGAPKVQQVTDRVKNARAAQAAEQFIAQRTGDPRTARYVANLVREGVAPPGLLDRMTGGDVRPVDTGQYIEFFDATTKQTVAMLPKSLTATPQLYQDKVTGEVSILFVNPQTRSVEKKPTGIVSKEPVDTQTAPYYLAARAVDKPLPDMPPWAQAMTPKEASAFLAALGKSKGGGTSLKDEIDALGADALRKEREKREAAAKAAAGGGATPPVTPGAAAKGKITIIAPDGTPGYWDASKPIPPGYKRQ